MNLIHSLLHKLHKCCSLEGCLSLSMPPGIDLPAQAGSDILQAVLEQR